MIAVVVIIALVFAFLAIIGLIDLGVDIARHIR